MKSRAFASAPLFANGLTHTLQLKRHLLVRSDDVVKRVGNLAFNACPGTRQPDGEITVAHTPEGREYDSDIK
jgi:hypothetical protein